MSLDEGRFLKKVASRKFMLASAAWLVGCAFLIARYIDAPQWIDLTKWVLGLYLAGDLGETYFSRTLPARAEAEARAKAGVVYAGSD